jgi:hypothetical protein
MKFRTVRLNPGWSFSRALREGWRPVDVSAMTGVSRGNNGVTLRVGRRLFSVRW